MPYVYEYLNPAVRTNLSLSIKNEDSNNHIYLVFRLNGNLFALATVVVSELFMSRISASIDAPKFRYQGNDIILYNIKQYLGLASSVHNFPQNAVICTHQNRKYAFNIDKIVLIHHIKPENIYYPPIECSALIDGVFPFLEQTVYIVNHIDLFICFDHQKTSSICNYDRQHVFSEL